MQDEGYKRCSKCGEAKPYGAFHKRKEGTLGLASQCKACRNARQRSPEEEERRKQAARDWYWANKERRQEYVKANRHLFRAQSRKRRADPAVHEQINAVARAKRKGNPEYIARVRAWQKAHPEAVALIDKRRTNKRRARTREQYVEDVHALVVLERDDGVCGICGADVDPLNFHVDHIVPLVRGGEHSYANAQIAHPACNARKGARLLVP